MFVVHVVRAAAYVVAVLALLAVLSRALRAVRIRLFPCEPATPLLIAPTDTRAALRSAEPRSRVVVVGALGLLGRSLLAQVLAEYGEKDAVVCADRRVPPPAQRDPRVTYIAANLANPDHVPALVHNARVVFHVASALPSNDTDELQLYRVNVVGTQMLVDAAQRAGVETLVYTSSALLVLRGGGTVERDLDESAPFPAHEMVPYTRTKYIAERYVLGANGLVGGAGMPMRTCAVRPSGIFGVGDHNLADVLVRGRRTFMLYPLPGTNEVDFVHADDCAHGHILAARALAAGDDRVAGQAFNVGGAHPMVYKVVLGGADSEHPDGLWGPPLTRGIPVQVMYALAHLNLWSYRILCWCPLPYPFCPELVQFMTRTYTFSSARAKHVLGYRPRTFEQAVQDMLAKHGRKTDAAKPAVTRGRSPARGST